MVVEPFFNVQGPATTSWRAQTESRERGRFLDLVARHRAGLAVDPEIQAHLSLDSDQAVETCATDLAKLSKLRREVDVGRPAVIAHSITGTSACDNWIAWPRHGSAAPRIAVIVRVLAEIGEHAARAHWFARSYQQGTVDYQLLAGAAQGDRSCLDVWGDRLLAEGVPVPPASAWLLCDARGEP